MKKRFPLGGNSRLGSILGGPLGGIVLPPAGNPLHTIGALTRVGAGGRTIAASNGTYGPYTVAGGVMTPNTSPVTPGTYDVGGITITVAANRFDVASVAEFQVVANGAAPLTLGDEIVICDGSYNPSRTGWTITRTNPPIGTWNGSNYIVVRGMTLGAVIGNVTCAGTGQDNFYFSFEGLTFDCAGRAGAQLPALSSTSGARFIRVKDNAFVGSVNAGRTTGTDLYDAINFNDTAAGNFVIEGNSFYDVDRPMVFSGPDCIIRNNLARRFWGDGIQIIDPCQRLKVIGNDLSDIKAGYTLRTVTGVTRGTTTQVTITDATNIIATDYITFVGIVGLDGALNRTYLITAVVGNVLTIALNSTAMADWVSGDVWHSGAHGDFCQGVFGGATDGQLDDIEISANRFTMGSAATPHIASGQGIFLTGHGAGVFLRRIRVQGNIIEANVAQGISLVQTLDGEICYNTMVKRLGWGQLDGNTTLNLGGSATGSRVYGNVANNLIIPASAAVNLNNYALAYDGTAYAAAFDAPVTGLDPVVANVNYAPKAGGPLAIASPIIGAVPHQSYVSPWTMTKPTPNTDAPAAPEAFTTGMWAILNPGTGGNLTVIIASLPFSNFATITNIEYRVNGGTWVSSGGIVGFNIPGLTNGVSANVELRAVNSAGSGVAGDTKSGTPTLDTNVRLVGYKVDAFGGAGTVTRSLTGLSGSVTAPRADDLVVLALFLPTNTNRAVDVVTAGYTGVSSLYANATQDTCAFAKGKIMPGTPDTSVQVSVGAESNGRPMFILVYENVDPTTPFDVAAPTPAAVAGTRIVNPPAITPITTGAKILVFGGAAHADAGAPAFSASYLSNVQTFQNGTISALFGEVDWTGGTYDPAAFTIAGNAASNSYIGITLTLRPKP